MQCQYNMYLINIVNIICKYQQVNICYIIAQSCLSIPSVMRVYVPRFFVSSQQRFGATDIKALGALRSWTNRATALRQISVTALFYLEDSRKIQDLKRREWRSACGGREREKERERQREIQSEREGEKSARTRERESQRKRFGSSFYMFFPPPGPALYKLGLARNAVCSVCSA